MSAGNASAMPHIIIVGGGIMGLSAAWVLRKHGARVTLIEQGPLPQPLGSSVDQHRLIRYPYGAQRGYARLVHAAYDSWQRLWRDLGADLYHDTGTLVISRPGDDWASVSAAALKQEGIDFQPLTPGEIAERFPYLNEGEIAEAFYCRSGGFLRAEAIVARLAAWLIEHGVAVLSKTAVTALEPERARATLGTGREIAGDLLLVCAGPWTHRLLPALAEKSRPSRQTVVYLTPPAEYRAAWLSAPMLLEIGTESGFYAVPPRIARDGMKLGLKIGDHRFGATADPDRDRMPAKDEIEAVLANARPRLKDAGQYAVAEAKTCFYDVAPEEKIKFERLSPRAFALCGSSGHGFKFGPVFGEAVAAALLGKADPALAQAYVGGAAPAGTIIPLPASASLKVR